MDTPNKILVVDLGGQYCHLIANRIRRLGVYSEIVQPEAPLETFRNCKGIILSGSPYSIVSEEVAFSKEVYRLGIPMLGLCYGHQMFARDLGGSVARQKAEFGFAEMDIKKESTIFEGLGKKEVVWMSHHDKVGRVPPGFEVIGTTPDCDTAAMADTERKFYGFQYHPEVTHTQHGLQMLSNFIFKICKCEKNWDMKRYFETIAPSIHKTVGNKSVFLLVSGGVDSTVCFALLNKVLGTNRVVGLHVDTGLMRKNESAMVKQVLQKHGFKNFLVHDASEEFFSALKEVYEPEKKRTIIGDTFISVQRKVLEGMKLKEEDWFLGQGTIYPDTIESKGTKHADLIKTHHNRVPLVEKMIAEGKVIEPLKELYKDEVREMGKMLGLPAELVDRHPFPGPGIGVRCLCFDGHTDNESLAQLNHKVNAFLEKTEYSGTVLPIKSVGVAADLRSYAHPVALQGPLDWEKIDKLSTALTNTFKGINRCVYAVSSHEKAELEKGVMRRSYLTRERVALCQDADDVVMKTLAERKIMQEMWQVPTVLIPFGVHGGETVVLRPVESTEAMTAAFYRMPKGALMEIKENILALKGVDALFYDVTHKPPGTIEWE